jgi:hypothetical protein
MVPGADPKLYEEVKDVTALVPTIEEYLSDYNAESKTPMKLVRDVVLLALCLCLFLSLWLLAFCSACLSGVSFVLCTVCCVCWTLSSPSCVRRFG